jgi:pyrimidine-specific ribonucleoside hydrolase
VPVVEGSDLGNTRLYFVDGLIPDEVPRQPKDIIGAVRAVAAATVGPIRWVGMGPLSNLADLQRTNRDLVDRLVVTQMGGAINYRDPSRAEHNFRMDVEAARHVLDTVERPTLVVSDVTFTSAIEITEQSPLYQAWASPDAPPWARMLRIHSDRWMAQYPGSMQHDALTLAAALLWPGIRFAREHVVLDDIGRMRRDPSGRQIKMSLEADYADFMRWLADRLSHESPVLREARSARIRRL